MSAVPSEVLLGTLAALLLASAWLSASESALLAINRYRLLHLVRSGDRGARLAQRLLEHPDRLGELVRCGTVLLTVSASAVATIACLRLFGDVGLLLATVAFTVIVLVFSDLAPKMLASRSPERMALAAAHVLWPLLKTGYPLVRAIRQTAAFTLRPFGHRGDWRSEAAAMPADELRARIEDGGGPIPDGDRRMLRNILALEEARVEDIMVPRNEIRAIDLNTRDEDLRRSLAGFPFSRAVVCRDGLDNVVGVLNLRNVIDLDGSGQVDAALIQARMRKPYFVPEGTRLPQQLVEFQRLRRRSALVVDEYGELIGLITLADILEEIVGEFTTAPKQSSRRIEQQPDGSVLVDGRIALHRLNRRLGWDLPTEEANTLSGLIVSRLETLPQIGDRLAIDGFSMRLQQVQDNVIRWVRIHPPGAPDPSDH